MRKKIFVFVFLGLFIFLGKSKIHAEEPPCSVYRGKYLDDKIVYEQDETKINYLSSICMPTVRLSMGGDIMGRHFYEGASKITCEKGGNPVPSNCSDYQTCTELDNKATCINGKNTCDCKNKGYYYDLLNNYSKYGDSCNSREEVCSGKKIEMCNDTGSWIDTGIICSDNQDCVNHQVAVGKTIAKCEPKCTHPATGGKMSNRATYCDTVSRTIKRCVGSKWEGVTFIDALDSECPSGQCIETNSGPKCNSGPFCSKITIEGKEHDVPDSFNNEKICFQNQIYTCNSNIYVPGTNCTDNKDGNIYCHSYPDGTATCTKDKDDANSIESLTITTTTSDAFWCDLKTKDTINTAIGCMPITVNGLVEKLLPTIFGIAGGIAFLMMVYGFIMVSTSSGDEKKVQEAQKIITSAITGLLVSLFALFLYRLIAVNILQIPGI